MNKLDIVNSVLRSMGSNLVNSLDDNNPEIARVVSVIDEVSTKLQSTGWWFNTERNAVLVKSTDGTVNLPSNILSVDSVDENAHYIQRNGKLYDTKNSTYTIGTNVTVRLVIFLEIEDLPDIAAYTVLDHAKYVYFMEDDGEANKANQLFNQYNKSLVELKAEHTRNADYNMQNNETYVRLRRPSLYTGGQYGNTYRW